MKMLKRSILHKRVKTNTAFIVGVLGDLSIQHIFSLFWKFLRKSDLFQQQLQRDRETKEEEEGGGERKWEKKREKWEEN